MKHYITDSNPMRAQFNALAGHQAKHFAYAFEAGVATITLNRPERKNPLTFDSYAELRDLFRALELASDVKVVVLTGAGGNASYGLQISVTGTATGSRGTITFSKGLAGELSSVLGEWLKSDGPLTTKTDGLNSSIKDLNKKADDINAKLPSIEARYRAQYAKLDALLSSLQSTSSSLTSQLAAISANS